MLSDVENVRKMVELLGDEGFVSALTNAEQLVDDVDETLGRVEQVEDEAAEAVREANEALSAVDRRLQRFDEAIRLIEAKIEAGFSVGFFFFALQQWTAGNVFLAAGLLTMGLLGISSLAVTIATMPQIRRLRQVGKLLTNRPDVDGDEDGDDPNKQSEPRIDRQTTDQQHDGEPGTGRPGRQTNQSRRDPQTSQSRHNQQPDQSRRDQQSDGQTDQGRHDERTSEAGFDRDSEETENKHGQAGSDDRGEGSVTDRQRDQGASGGRRSRMRSRDQIEDESEERERTDTEDESEEQNRTDTEDRGGR